MERIIGTVTRGLRTPIINQGDDLKKNCGGYGSTSIETGGIRNSGQRHRSRYGIRCRPCPGKLCVH